MTSIYDQIGGDEAISAVVDDFYDRVLADPGLAGYFAGTNLNRLKGRQVEFFAGALGGPDHYRGQTMKEAHRGRGIGRPQFDRVAQLLAESLRDAGVPPELVGQILTAIAPLAEDIVSPAATAAPQV
ncbi:group 1 truncated hemoglobin [Amycolatopsis acidiphila]|uniref:Group 1 truncated hemoglobin n=1 Tax=Amycolatopsis acidiphila TaxID=715473 RepID=A0A557ZWA0_9PSEU|nr:group 1 truncated hemoglobin [Amycolatopsis acidiphila]TVT16296.1 group 1 truncated hemoglobin [Amycolatopsis acidiphila]UIJ56824.1 group 1 truncated hemoglobin [Amycolatopsis acidiphila]GHG54929.1 group 1 truncated hemoglobin GlbN [Amycolatopsis acidiphila]